MIKELINLQFTCNNYIIYIHIFMNTTIASKMFNQPDPWETSEQPPLLDDIQYFQDNIKISNISTQIITPQSGNRQINQTKNQASVKSQSKQSLLSHKNRIQKHRQLFRSPQTKNISNKINSVPLNKLQRFPKKQKINNTNQSDKQPIVRMQSCYPKLQNKQYEKKRVQVHSLQPIKQYEAQQIAKNKIRSKSQKKASPASIIQMRNISTYDINKNFQSQKGTTKIIKNSMRNQALQFDFCTQTHFFDKRFRKNSDKSQQFGDMSFFWKSRRRDEKNHNNCKADKKVKKVIQYSDKWSINFLKKSALTNKQITNNQTKGHSLYI